jgi:hypothetical protein
MADDVRTPAAMSAGRHFSPWGRRTSFTLSKPLAGYLALAGVAFILLLAVCTGLF